MQNDEDDEEEEEVEVPQPTPTQDPKPKALPPKTPDQKESTILKVPVVVGRGSGTPLSSTAENGKSAPSSLSPPTPPPPPTKIRVRTDLMHLGLMEKRPPQQPTTSKGLAKPQQQAPTSSNLMQILNGPPLKSGDKSKAGGQAQQSGPQRFPTLGKVPVVPGSAAAAAAAGSAASPVTTAASVAYAQSRSGNYRNSILFASAFSTNAQIKVCVTCS